LGLSGAGRGVSFAMELIKEFRLTTLALFLNLLATSGFLLHAQDAADPPPPAIDISAAAAAPSTKISLPTIAELTAQKHAAALDTDLDDATRTLLDQLFAKTIENLQAIEQAEARYAALIQELEGAPQRVAELQQRLGTPLKEDVVPENADRTKDLDALTNQLKESEDAASTLRQKNQEITAEAERRAARRPQLAELRNTANQQLQEVGQSLLMPAPEGELAQVTAIRMIRLQSRQLRLRREIALLEQEAKSYEGTTRLWTLQRDLTERNIREADRIVQYWQQQTAEARRRQAEDEAIAARKALALSHESVRKEAERNRELADENARIVEARQQTRKELDRVDADVESRAQAFESLQIRAEAAEFSPAIGVLLRKQRMTLPDRDDIERRIAIRQTEISALNLQLMEWEAERKPLIDLVNAAARIVDKLESPAESISLDELREQVQVILAARLQRLGDLVENGSAQLDQLVQLDGQEKRLLAKVDEESHWLAEHVLWVRSTGVIGTQPRSFVNSASVLLDWTTWHRIGGILWQDLTDYRWGWGISLLSLMLLLVLRRRSKQRIRILGEYAARSNCVEMMPTVKAMMLTLFVALPFPTAMYLLGIRIEGVSGGENTLRAFGIALQTTAAAWLVIELIRQVAQPDSMGDSHFEWAESSMTSLRRTMRLMAVALLPALLVVAYTESLGEDEMISSVGRLAYLITMGWAGFAAFRLVRPDSPILQALENEHSHDLLWRTRWGWTGILLCSPIVLSGLSMAGFHYTAVQLTNRVAATIGCGLVALTITAFLSRWLLMSYRKLAIQRGRERRRQMLLAAQADPDQPIPQDATPELRLADINDQTSRMLRVMASVGTLLALYLIWIDVLPALGILGKIELWENTLAAKPDDITKVWVTAADLMLAFLIGALTLVASRNVPGLMEIVVLQRLPLDAGARYAASTVSRYLIVLTGFLLGFRAIGIGWSSVQWLVAAVTVGLGFGLQEIFANFVSGIILLFERPIRVGDTVTVSAITGTVARIQIRATTILDWDNKELIVPNREFVTGHLVNWTLTNPMLRLIVGVGVAYGSDTRLATQLLYQVAEENDQVLEEPEPVVVFQEFGESSLNFELRLYVNGLMNYRRLRHDLNLAIDDLFRQHKIEIAFPQRDLHVRSLPDRLIPEKTSKSSPQSNEM
jgi:potassium efflux system protein